MDGSYEVHELRKSVVRAAVFTRARARCCQRGLGDSTKVTLVALHSYSSGRSHRTWTSAFGLNLPLRQPARVGGLPVDRVLRTAPTVMGGSAARSAKK